MNETLLDAEVEEAALYESIPHISMPFAYNNEPSVDPVAVRLCGPGRVAPPYSDGPSTNRKSDGTAEAQNR